MPIRRPILPVLLLVAVLVSAGAAAPAVASPARSLGADTARSHSTKSGCRLPRGRIAVGGTCGWVGVLRFGVGGSRPSRAVLRLSAPRSAGAALRVRVRGAGASVLRRFRRDGTLAIDVSRMLPAAPREVVITVTSRSRRTIRLARTGRRAARLDISARSAPADRGTARPGGAAPLGPGRVPDTPAPAYEAGNVWISAAELAARPMSGPG
jgi:hypothetical protein